MLSFHMSSLGMTDSMSKRRKKRRGGGGFGCSVLPTLGKPALCTRTLSDCKKVLRWPPRVSEWVALGRLVHGLQVLGFACETSLTRTFSYISSLKTFDNIHALVITYSSKGTSSFLISHQIHASIYQPSPSLSTPASCPPAQSAFLK